MGTSTTDSPKNGPLSFFLLAPNRDYNKARLMPELCLPVGSRATPRREAHGSFETEWVILYAANSC